MTVRTQTRYPGAVVSDDAVGTLAWSDPDKAEAEDNDPATATGPGISEWLLCSGYGFNLPSDAEPLEALILPRGRTTSQGYAEIERIGGHVVASNGIGNLTVPRSSLGEIQDGDLIVTTVISLSNGNTTNGGPDEWTAAANTQVFLAEDLFGRHAVWYHRITDLASEPANYFFTHSSLGWRAALTNVFRNVDEATPFDVIGVASGGASTTHNLGSVTTVTPFALLCGSMASAVAPTDGTGMDLVQTSSAGAQSRFWTEERPSTGATGARSVTTGTDSLNVRRTFALRPARTNVVDDAVRIVVDGVVGDEDHAGAEPWGTSFATRELGPFDITSLTPTEVNEDLGCALAVDLADDVNAGVDAVPVRVTYETAVDITPTTTTLEAPNDTLEATFEVGGSACTMNNTRWQIATAPSASAIVYDSGVVVSSATSHVIGSGTPVVPWVAPLGDTTYYLRVTGTEDGTADPDGVGDPISGDSGWVEITTDWTLPTAPTGLAAVAVTEAP